MKEPKVRLRWGGNSEAQRQADQAFRTLRTKPKRLTKKQKAAAKKQKARETCERNRIRNKEKRRKSDYERYIGSSAWRRKRKEALDHYGHLCSRCGNEHDLRVHHLTYKNFKNERMEDLQILCRDCHDRLHDPDHISDRLTRVYLRNRGWVKRS